MIFNWILLNKFAIGTPILKKNEKKILESNGIKTILDLRNSSDLDKSYKEKYFNFGFSEDLKVNSSADFSFVFGFEIKI